MTYACEYRKTDPSIAFSPSATLPLSLLLAFSGELITAERRHEYANRTRKDTRDCRAIFHDFHDFHDLLFSRHIRHTYTRCSLGLYVYVMFHIITKDFSCTH